MMTRRVYMFCTGAQADSDDIMWGRIYVIDQGGAVVRYCIPTGTSARIRQPISRVQCAREMRYLDVNGFVCIRTGGDNAGE